AGQKQLAAEADGPADPGVGCIEGCGSGGAHEPVVDPRKCHAAFQIPHPVADGDADAWRHRCKPFHLGGPRVISKKREQRTQRTNDSLRTAGPSAAGFDTNEPAVAHLPIVADVATGEPAVHGVIGNADGGAPETNIAKAPAAMDADVKPAPG